MAGFESIVLYVYSKPLEWRPVPGYEGLYEVSEYGDVDSLSARNGAATVPRRRKMKPFRGERDYRRVQLSKSGKVRCLGVHELVALAFIGPKPPGKDVVAHWDGYPWHNHRSNLRWATHAENEEDKRRHGRHLAGERNHRAKLANEQVVELRLRHADGEKLSRLCREYGISRAQGSKIVLGQTFTEVDGPIRGKCSGHGSENGLAKLTEDSVREIRRLHASKEARSSEIARRFGIHPSNVQMIMRRETWTHVD